MGSRMNSGRHTSLIDARPRQRGAGRAEALQGPHTKRGDPRREGVSGGGAKGERSQGWRELARVEGARQDAARLTARGEPPSSRWPPLLRPRAKPPQIAGLEP